ncbi:MAG: PAS domain-containing protein [Alphaproteobacteria bacterium]|nr:PAS domain-containing protein [Alphaproteobacteria bacterium]MBL6938723.1 PAS domain-containing protein [Alphaproteobacteria bacterium]
MQARFDFAAAGDALNALDLGPLNRELASHWLSLWKNDAPPTRGAINPARMKAFLPGLAIMGLYPDDTIRFRIAGTVFKSAFGFDPTGHDMLALTAPEQRADRLARCRRLAFDTVAVGIRLSARTGEPDMIAQDLMLPLSGVNKDGSRSWLFHNSWRPNGGEWRGGLTLRALGMTETFVARVLRPI